MQWGIIALLPLAAALSEASSAASPGAAPDNGNGSAEYAQASVDSNTSTPTERAGSADANESDQSEHQATLPDLSLSNDGYRRPLPTPESELTGFNRYNNAADRSGNALWIRDKGSQLKGFGLSMTPGQGRGDGLSINTAYLGKGLNNETGMASPVPNNVWSVGITGRMWDRTLELHGEYAASRQTTAGDPDSLDTASGGDAYDLRLTFKPDPLAFGGMPLQWRVRADRSTADQTFWSLGEAPGGDLRESLASDMAWGRLDANITYSRRRHLNVTEDSEDSSWHNQRVSARLNYHAEPMTWLPLGKALLGQSRYTLRVERNENANNGAWAAVDTAALYANFDPGPWQWQLGHSRSRRYDAQQTLYYLHSLTTLRLRWPLREALVIEPAFRWNTEQSLPNQDVHRATTGEILAKAVMIPDRLNARFNVNSRLYSHDSQDIKRHNAVVESGLDWMVRPQRGRNPRITLSINGRLEAQRHLQGTGEDMNRYHVFAGFEAAWPDA